MVSGEVEGYSLNILVKIGGDFKIWRGEGGGRDILGRENLAASRGEN